MEIFLTDFSPSALAAANRENLLEMFGQFEFSSTAEFKQLPDGFYRWYNALPHNWFNGVMCPRAAQPEDIGLVDDALGYFGAKGCPEFSFWLANDVERSGWEELLGGRGFQVVEGPPGMGVALKRLPASLPAIPGFEIRPVTTQDELRECAWLINDVYEFPRDCRPQAYDMMRGMGLNDNNPSYLGWLDGVPVASVSAFYGAGVVGIYNVATRAEARGKGIGSAVTLHALQEARSLGYQAGILQASEMGEPIYRRLGFEVNCHIGWFNYTFA
jgi:GNAT superfamily N-acetyltransferase